MLEGLQRLRDRGNFLDPISCVEAKKDWLGESNNVFRFVRDCLVITKNLNDCAGSWSTIYDVEYAAWCQMNSIEENVRKGKINMRRDLEAMGLVFRISHGNVIKVYGCELVESKEGVEGSEQGSLDDFDSLDDF
jgi:hypothetical protein